MLLLDTLSDDTLVHIFSLLPTADVGRVACTSARHCVLSHEPLLYASVSITPATLRHRQFLHRLGLHTREIRVFNKPGVGQRHRACRHVPFLRSPYEHRYESACGSLLDAGVAVLLDKCGASLERIALPGQAHLTSSTLAAVLRACPRLKALCLRGCDRVLHGFSAEAVDGFPPQLALRDVDLSHTHATDVDLRALLERASELRALAVNFNPSLTDAVLDAIPRSVARVEALGCERFTYPRLVALEKDLARADEASARDDEPGGARAGRFSPDVTPRRRGAHAKRRREGGGRTERLKCDDSLVLALNRPGHHGSVARSLLDMLFEYHTEEARIE